MRARVLAISWVAAAIVGCSTTAPEAPSGSEPPATESAETSSPAYYALEELTALGLLSKPLEGDRTLVCGPDGGGCVCLEPLPCEAAGDCIGFDENLATFRSALAPQEGAKVHCDRAEIGRCGDFRYFLFEGDLERRELRWFDETGALVGQRNETDYQAYCDGQTRARFEGRLPRCSELSSVELICGEAPGPMAPPLEDLRRFTTGPQQAKAAAQP